MAGREIDFEPIVIAPIAETGAMAENNARSDFGEAVVIIILNVRLGEVGGERNVESEFALIDEFEDGVGEDGLAERSGFEDGVIGDGIVGFSVLDAETVLPVDFAVLKGGNGEAGNVSQAHEFRNLFFELSCGELACGSDGMVLRAE